MNRSRRATPHVPSTKHHSNPKHRGWFPSHSEERPTDDAAACDEQLEPGNLAEREEAAMAKRLEVWVQRHLACLPKSESRLLRALRTDLCSVKRQVWTADAVFDRLVRMGHIDFVADEPHNQEDCRPRNRDNERPQMARERALGRSRSGRRPAPARQLQRRVRVQLIFRALPEKRVESEGEADDESEEEAMKKVMRWVERQEAHPQLRPTSVEAAKSALAQLCVVNVGFQPERLVELLAAKNYLRLEQTEEESSKAEKKVVWLLKQTVEGCPEGKRKSEDVGDQDDELQGGSKTETNATQTGEKQDSACKRMRSL